jgi:hypothetical protein
MGYGMREGDDPLTMVELEEAFEELYGCIIRRPGDCCEVRKEFLAVALDVLSARMTAQKNHPHAIKG